MFSDMLVIQIFKLVEILIRKLVCFLEFQILFKCDVWNDWMVETLTEMQKLRRGATAVGDFNRQSFAQQMITRIRNVKSEIVNAQGTVIKRRPNLFY